jgi:hypothetical protein
MRQISRVTLRQNMRDFYVYVSENPHSAAKMLASPKGEERS